MQLEVEKKFIFMLAKLRRWRPMAECKENKRYVYILHDDVQVLPWRTFLMEGIPECIGIVVRARQREMIYSALLPIWKSIVTRFMTEYVPIWWKLFHEYATDAYLRLESTQLDLSCLPVNSRMATKLKNLKNRIQERWGVNQTSLVALGGKAKMWKRWTQQWESEMRGENARVRAEVLESQGLYCQFQRRERGRGLLNKHMSLWIRDYDGSLEIWMRSSLQRSQRCLNVWVWPALSRLGEGTCRESKPNVFSARTEDTSSVIQHFLVTEQSLTGLTKDEIAK